MIDVHMPAGRLAGLRWAISPVGELAAALVGVSEAPNASRRHRHVRALLSSGRLPTLAAVTRGYTTYLPELLTPAPRAFLPTVEDQLHAVATTPTGTVGTQFTAFLTGGQARSSRCPWLRDGELAPADEQVRSRIEVGESDLRERLASELHWLWSKAMAPHWPQITAGFEGFVERHGAVAAREGLGNALAALHSSLRWQEGALKVASGFDGEVGGEHPVTLIPTLFLDRVGLHAPLRPGEAQLAIPIAASGDAVAQIAPVLGATRLAILHSLAEPRTTAALAALHHLAPATVSFHLSRLLAADLVQRQRAGRHVHYRHTARARAILRPVSAPASVPAPTPPSDPPRPRA
ncbi:winged helix-turn-helix domain-containing protein [Streptomyces lincolnensis]|uniref:ArsR/SmtB family transcription factor n=1 Tax=Streptomyces lincolnensis TaxID=1915 RepID=UPI001E4E1692|nr:winged helix-turn-helix domain-containing protein [Streptomyces lincolnensis]MCD7445529.1 winged helix-turn-helix domain-containing protein [Streptomyces lincolnensis]